MKPYIPVVAPRLLDFFEYFSPLGKGGDGIVGIANITLPPFIFSAQPMDEGDEVHEGIHVYQVLECGVVGGLIVVPTLLLLGAPWWMALLAFIAGFTPGIGWFFLIYYVTQAYWVWASKSSDFKSLSPGLKGYYLIPFEREAYLYDGDGFDYFKKRKFFAWVRISKAESERAGEELSEQLFNQYKDSHAFANIFTRKKA